MEDILNQILSELKDLKSGQNNLEQRFDGFEQRFDGFEQRFDGFEQKLDQNRDDMINKENFIQWGFLDPPLNVSCPYRTFMGSF